MKSLVIFDSWYGNTQKIANEIAIGLGRDARLAKVGRNTKNHLQHYDLLVLGCPTHGGVATPAMQQFLNSLDPDDIGHMPVAAFDTRVKGRWLKVIGFASNRIAKQLEHKSGILSMPPEGFYVEGKRGPLCFGEKDRAKKWGSLLAQHVGMPSSIQ